LTVAVGSQVRGVAVAIESPATGAQCAAIYVAGPAQGPSLRDVRVQVGIGAQGYGIRVVSPNLLEGVITLQDIVVDVNDNLVFGATGIWVTGGSLMKIRLSDVQILARTLGGMATAVRLTDADATLDRVEATAAVVGSFATLRALVVEGAASNVAIHRSSLRAATGEFAVRTSGTLRIANSLLEGTL